MGKVPQGGCRRDPRQVPTPHSFAPDSTPQLQLLFTTRGPPRYVKTSLPIATANKKLHRSFPITCSKLLHDNYSSRYSTYLQTIWRTVKLCLLAGQTTSCFKVPARARNSSQVTLSTATKCLLLFPNPTQRSPSSTSASLTSQRVPPHPHPSS